jgi:hypothetical protein
MVLGDSRIQHRHHLAGAREAEGRRAVGLDQRHALRQRGPNRHILLHAVDPRVVEQSLQRSGVGVHGQERDGFEQGDGWCALAADGAVLLPPRAEIGEQALLVRAEPGALRFGLPWLERVLVEHLFTRPYDDAEVVPFASARDQRVGVRQRHTGAVRIDGDRRRGPVLREPIRRRHGHRRDPEQTRGKQTTIEPIGSLHIRESPARPS